MSDQPDDKDSMAVNLVTDANDDGNFVGVHSSYQSAANETDVPRFEDDDEEAKYRRFGETPAPESPAPFPGAPTEDETTKVDTETGEETDESSELKTAASGSQEPSDPPKLPGASKGPLDGR